LDTKNGPELKRILSTSGYTSDILDYSLSWHLVSVLEGLGVLDYDTAGAEAQESILHVYFGYMLQLESLGAGPELVLYVAMHMPTSRRHPFLRETTVCDILAKTVSLWVNDGDRMRFFTEKLNIPLKWVHGCRAIWHKYRHEHEPEFEAYMAAEAYAEAFEVFSQHLGPQLFLRECNHICNAFVPFPCGGLKSKVDALEQHRGALLKRQQQELSRYSFFIQLVASGSRGESGEMSFDRLMQTFSAKLQALPSSDPSQVARQVAIMSKMCTVYAESLRYKAEEPAKSAEERIHERIVAARVPHMTPEAAITQIQDAASLLTTLTK